jgi:hypothetical protein
MNSIEKASRIDRHRLSEGGYFESLVQEALQAGILENTDLEKLQTRVIELLAGQTRRFTSGESSSIRTERAQTILESIYYTLGIRLKAASDPDQAAGLLLETPLDVLFAEGQTRLKQRIEDAELLYAKVRSSRIKTPNYAYNATIDTGIASFFRAYDPEFSAAETPALIDYPISGTPIETTGIEFVMTYMERLLYENRFCGGFSSGQIHAVMTDYHRGYPDLLINIYDQVAARVLDDGSLPDIPIRETPQPTIRFEDSTAMEDDSFREVTEKIRDCRTGSEKLDLIREKIRSFTDLRDVLRSECLFDDEFRLLFRMLGDMEIALLLRETQAQRKDEDLYLTENEKEWQNEFRKFFDQNGPAYQKKIRELSRKIML